MTADRSSKAKNQSEPRLLKGRPNLHGTSTSGNANMSSGGGDDRSRIRRRNNNQQQDRGVRRSTSVRQLITFVDSQDPNSRSTIQRHTAHHSNAQRRDARLQSLRNVNRPRVLEWTRRPSAEMLPITSPSSSTSSTSISPIPLSQPQIPTVEGIATTSASEGPPTTPPGELTERSSPEREPIVRYLSQTLCTHSPNHAACEEIIAFAQTDEACSNLLLAYSISFRLHNGESINRDLDHNIARRYLNRGTSLLRTRLSNSLTASADANIQAVLLLIAYTADYGSFQEVQIHANALRTMTDQRGRVEDGNYPPILALQLRSIGLSRFFHLTLDCGEACPAVPRFPHGLHAM